MSDDIPENDEQFTVTLSNPGGGALLADSNTQAQLIISSNDVPVRFGNSTTSVFEDAGTLTVTVYRGSLFGGEETIGPIDQLQTTVDYSTSGGTATPGEDYTPSTGTITFQPGDTTQTISIPITNDDMPEGDESFTISLSNPSGGSVLVSPSLITAIISINDNAGGVVRFQSTDNQTISEDAQSTATFVIEREESMVGTILIGWSILDENNQLAVDDFYPPNGTVSLAAGNNQTTLTIKAFNDALPELAETFTVTIDEVLGGAAKLDNETLRVALLFVADSDDIYGAIDVAPDSGSVAVESVSAIIIRVCLLLLLYMIV